MVNRTPLQSRRLTFLWVALAASLLVALSLLAACATPAAVATATPTKTQRPASSGFRQVQPAPALDIPIRTLTPTTPPTAAPTPAPTSAPTETPVPPTAAPTEAPAAPQLTVTGATANLRRGPGTNYPSVGTARQGDTFEVTGRNAGGDWLQICCVDGEPAWITASLAQVTNAEQIALVTDIPAPPTAAPKPPAATRAPAPAAPPPAAPPASDPCAGIGGDGCKFRVTGGPRTADNGGMELKLQFFFMHSGVDGGQPQGSYFVVMEKGGQRLPIPDSVRSVALTSNEGSLGKYNYEFSLGANSLPGGSVAGDYAVWVLDGNGERDSRNVTFTIPAGQGLLWIQFDQG